MKIRTALSVLVPALLVLSACGDGESKGGSSSKEGKEYVAALAGSITDDEDTGAIIDEKQATCWSAGVVDIVGVDQLKKGGTPEEFATGGDSGGFDLSAFKVTEKQAGAIYDKFDDCGVDLHQMMLKSFGEGDGALSAEAQGCLGEALTEDRLRDFMTAGMTKGEAAQDDPAFKALTSALMTCAMADMKGAAPTPTPGS